MCGIVAFYSQHGNVSPDHVKQALSTLSHRGPDAHGIWINTTKQVGLGHARLSIIDLKTGTQPLHRNDNRVHAIVNGEFYDFKLLRDNLTEKGYCFQTQSDSEILLALYTFYGMDCFTFLNGEFAFVLFDETHNAILVARDRFGVKPLYWAHYNHTFYFASEAKALIAAGMPARWNEYAVWRILGGLTSQEDSSCFLGVKSIKPGHAMRINVNTGDYSQHCYWDAQFSADEHSVYPSDGDLIAEFNKLFEKAVKRRLQADVPVACYLSGGIDSSAVATVAASQSPTPVTAFHVAFEESDDLNESHFAQQVATQAQLNFSRLSVSMKDIVTHYADTIWHTERPFLNGYIVAKFLLSRHAHQHGFKVVLTGEGADELLAGYSHLWAECLERSNHKTDQDVIRLIKTMKQQYGYKEPKIPEPHFKDIVALIGYAPYLFTHHHSLNALVQPLYTDGFKQQYATRQLPLEVIRELKLHTQQNNAFSKSLYLGLKTEFPTLTLNVAGDATEMAHAVEGRLPFLDIDLVTFLLALPHHLRARGSMEKYLLKEAMKMKLPQAIYERRKQPLWAPSYDDKGAMKSPIYDYMRDIFDSEYLVNIPFLNPKAVRAFFHETVNHVQNDQLSQKIGILHALLGLCLLGHQYQLTA